MTNKTLPNVASDNPGVAIQTTDIFLARQTGAAITTQDSAPTGSQFLTFVRSLVYGVAGQGISIKEGTNAKAGVVTLVAGTATIANTSVTANSRIKLSIQSLGTVIAPKAIGVSARVAATSFTILSADATDTSVIYWEINENT